MDWVKPSFMPSSCKTKDTSQNANSRKKKCVKPPSLLFDSDGLDTNWDIKYAPKRKEDLVIHKKKIEEVEGWLVNVKNSTSAHFLLILGPPGCGKLATLRVLCEANNLSLTEWTQSCQPDFDPTDRDLHSTQEQSFDNFVIRSCRYSSVLTLSSNVRIIVVKDIPNTFIRTPALLHELLKKYSQMQSIRIVFILNEPMVVKALFPEELKFTLGLDEINFNPVTQRSVVTALNKIINHLEPSKKNNLSKLIPDISLSCNGDLRHAIMTLQFVSVKGSMPSKSPPSKRKKKKDTDHQFLTMQNDAFVDIFHGLGRILYAKREEGKLVHDPYEVAESFTSTSNQFIGMLEENAPERFSSIGQLSDALCSLSSADLLLSDWSDMSRKSALYIACGGVMSANKNPIKKFQPFKRSQGYEAATMLSSVKNVLRTAFDFSSDSENLIDLLSYSKCLLKSHEKWDLLKNVKGFS